MKKLLTVALIFGGKSQEHAASVATACDMFKALKNEKGLKLVPIFISQKGEWFNGEQIIAGSKKTGARAFLDTSGSGAVIFAEKSKKAKTVCIDAVIPWVLGPNGEDGAMAGLMEMANIPYVGSGIFAAACGFNKRMTKQYITAAGIPQVPYVSFTKDDWQFEKKDLVKHIFKTLQFPLFVKPASCGSSIGVSKVKKQKDFDAAVKEALKFDDFVVVETGVENAVEAECAVLGYGEDVQVSVPGAAQFEGEFYDYHAKYVAKNWSVAIPPRLPKKTIAEVQRLAKEVFVTLDAGGLARVDFLVDGKTNKVYFNEINTYPTFRAESMVTHLLGSIGISYVEAIKRLVKLAIKRHAEKNKKQLVFGGKVKSLHL